MFETPTLKERVHAKDEYRLRKDIYRYSLGLMLPVLTCSKGVLFHDDAKILNASTHTLEIEKSRKS